MGFTRILDRATTTKYNLLINQWNSNYTKYIYYKTKMCPGFIIWLEIKVRSSWKGEKWGRENAAVQGIFPVGIIGSAERRHYALPWNATVSLIAAFRIITVPMWMSKWTRPLDLWQTDNRQPPTVVQLQSRGEKHKIHKIDACLCSCLPQKREKPR